MTSERAVRADWTVTDAQTGRRVDQVAAEIWPEFSRSRFTEWIRAGRLTVDGREVKPNFRVEAEQAMRLDAVLEDHPANPEPEAMSLRVLYQDEALMVIDKPAGLVVHPGSGNTAGTLVNGLLHHDPDLAALPRAGLVHRLDKDTSGCLLIARTPGAHARLVQMLKRREIHRAYVAVVWGRVIAGGSVDAPLGRHPVDRRRQVVRDDGRRAVTHYRVGEHLNGATVLDLELETGRTHQIRVHMQHIGFPLLGDPFYGRRGSPAGLTQEQRDAWRGFPRQALHARELRLRHPDRDQELAVRSPLPDDMRGLVECLRPGD